MIDLALGQIAFWFGAFAAATFGGASILKLRSPAEFRQQLRDYELFPERVVVWIAVAVPAAELLGAVGFAFSPTRSVALVGLIAMLAAFSAVVAVALRAGRTSVACACFGSSSTRLDRSILMRNLLLALSCAMALAWPNGAIRAAASVFVALLVLLVVLGFKARLLGAESV